MRNLLLAAGMALMLTGSTTAHALEFDFSFSDDGSFAPFNLSGTVTGEITGLTDNATGLAAAHVYIDSYPAGLVSGLTTPFDTVGDSLFNSFKRFGW
jgi:hypothetical protein